MADIFLSYTEQDREQARRVATMLESVGWSVWWDRRIPAGETWRSVLEEALQNMRCMIVLWSARSIESEWVSEEATEGRRVGKLVPVLIEPVRPPAGFREIQAADLTNWDGSPEFEGMRMLVADLQRLLGNPVPGATDIPMTSSDHGHAYDPADRVGGATTTDRWPRRGLSSIVAVGVLLLVVGAAIFALSLREPTMVTPRASVTEPQQPRKFTAYGITQEDDPLSQAMRGLIDNASSQEHQIALLWQAIEKLSACVKTGDCVPDDAALKEQFEAGKLNDLVGK